MDKSPASEAAPATSKKIAVSAARQNVAKAERAPKKARAALQSIAARADDDDEDEDGGEAAAAAVDDDDDDHEEEDAEEANDSRAGRDRRQRKARGSIALPRTRLVYSRCARLCPSCRARSFFYYYSSHSRWVGPFSRCVWSGRHDGLRIEFVVSQKSARQRAAPHNAVAAGLGPR